MLSYENLRLNGIFSSVTISSITIDECYNDHAHLNIEGAISPVAKEKYLQQSLEDETLTLTYMEETYARTIFSGVILGTIIRHSGGSYKITIKAISHTYLLDIAKESRSYQDVSMSYAEVVNAELSGRYAVHIDCYDEWNMPVKEFLLKYQETCWEFMKRLASHHLLGLLPDMARNKPAFYIGMPEDREVRHIAETPDQILRQPHSIP